MKVAVLDDTREDAQRFLDYINQFQEQKKCLIQTDVYHASMPFMAAKSMRLILLLSRWDISCLQKSWRKQCVSPDAETSMTWW